MSSLQQTFGNIDIYLFDQLLRGRIAPGMRVLDAGCGGGRNLVYLLREGYEVFAADADRSAVESVRRLAATLAPGLPADNFRVEPIEAMTFPDAFADVVISNGVINLATDKSKVFREAARLLKSGGRFAISDIVTEVQLPETIVCNSTLWAACIGGAAQQDNYRQMIAATGLQVVTVQDNPQYQFISDNAKGASKKFGVKSVSLLAVKT